MEISSRWMKNAVIYEVYPLTFRNTDASGPLAAYGDLPGVTEKLDYISSLSPDVLWLTPIFESPLKDGFGYNISDYKKISAAVGNDGDFDTLVTEAHARGLKVILDMVFCHTSDEHEWFRESKTSRDNPYADFYVWADPLSDENGQRRPPNNWLSMDLQHPSAWEWCEERGQYYLHSFNRSMPALNIANPKVEEALLDVARHWLDKGADGFRLDALTHMGHDVTLQDNPVVDANAGYAGQMHTRTTARPEAKAFLRKLRDMMNARPPKTLPGQPDKPYLPALVGEALGNPEFAHSLVREGLIDTVFTGALNGTLHNFRQVVEGTLSGSGEGDCAWALSNHDLMRVLDRALGGTAEPQHAVLYAGMLASLPGSVMLFQGDELGLRQGTLAESRTDDPLGLTQSAMGEIDASRAGMPWADASHDTLWLKPAGINKMLAPETQDGAPASTLSRVREIFQLRRNHPALHGLAAPQFLDTGDTEVMALVRHDAQSGKSLMCAFNFSRKKKMIVLKQDGEVVSDITCAPLDAGYAPLEGVPRTGLSLQCMTRR